MYKPSELLVLQRQIRAICLTWINALFLAAGVIFVLRIGIEISRGSSILFAACGLLALIGHRAIVRQVLARGLAETRFTGRNIVLIADDSSVDTTYLTRRFTNKGFRVTRNFRLPHSISDPHQRQKVVASVIEYARGSDVEEIVIAADPERWSDLRALGAELTVLPFSVSFVPLGTPSELFRLPHRELGDTVFVELQRSPLTSLEEAAKRSIDVLFAGLALTVLLPLLAIVAISIKLDSRGPILFRQRRYGFNGESFQILKFRTMTVIEDGPSITQAQFADKRVTRLGALLRGTSIDDMPQLLNVLDGSMSLVGPRPHAIAHDNEFDKILRDYAFRRRVKPGLTGWAQVHGYGPTPTAASIERRVAYDLWYIDNWSLWLDFAIFLWTPIVWMRSRTLPDDDYAPRQVRSEPKALVSRRVVPDLSVGNHRYPLHRASALQYDGELMRLGYLVATGSTWDIALESISRRLHRDFQTLWLIPPHERSASQQAQLEKLTEIVDLDAYLEANREEEMAIGRIDSIDDHVVRVTLLTHEDRQITAQLNELPAIAAGMQSGEFFEARILIGEDRHIEWRNWTVRPPLREDNDVWADFDKLTAREKSGD
jgi:putative colanic acid biosynthesis UDP-glucose lipid carrier transferase